MKKLFILIFCLISFQSIALEKKTTFSQEVFNKAQSEGKIVVVSSWIKYCSSCEKQMKVLNKAIDDFQNIVYLNFDVGNKEISNKDCSSEISNWANTSKATEPCDSNWTADQSTFPELLSVNVTCPSS